MVEIKPILDEHLDAVCAFLHDQMNPAISTQDWRRGFDYNWLPERPNNGFMIEHENTILGVFPAYYSKQLIDGAYVQICNPHSWVVLKQHRRLSGKLQRTLLSQDLWNFYIVTPNIRILKLFEKVGYEYLDNKICVILNIRTGSGVVLTDQNMICTCLKDEALRHYKNHANIPNWKHLVVGDDRKGWCHVVYRFIKYKRSTAVEILYISDAKLFARFCNKLGFWFLSKHGAITMHIEARFLIEQPAFSFVQHNTQPKMFISKHLKPHQFINLYTELAVMSL